MSIKHTSVASFTTTPTVKTVGAQPSRMLQLSVMLLMLALMGSGKLHAQDGGVSYPYHVFNPVPRDQMREFSIDRPDVTESPNTVDAGHFQFEGDLIKWTRDSQYHKSNRTISVFSGLYKMGLLKSWDIHLGLEMYNIYKDFEGHTLEKGYGTTTIRLKHNFWGNDGDTKTALGVIPYISFPSSDQGGEEVFGVGFPFSFAVDENLGGGAQFQVDFLPDGEGGHDAAFLQTIVIGGALIGDVDFYAELAGYFLQDSDSYYFANGGLIYNIGQNVKVDVATNLGLTKTTPTRAYVGLSFRI
jgi:hypothetical protein